MKEIIKQNQYLKRLLKTVSLLNSKFLSISKLHRKNQSYVHIYPYKFWLLYIKNYLFASHIGPLFPSAYRST